MIYLQTHNRRPRGRAGLYVILVLLIVGGVVHFFAPYVFPALMHTIAVPFWRMEFSATSGSLQSPEHLLLENETLKRSLIEAQATARSAYALELENVELKSLLGRASSTPYVLAAVLERPPFAAYDMLVIDAGTDVGFVEGDLVYAPGNILIGRISQVLAHSSKVVLFSSPGEKYEVLIGPSHAPATAVGRGGGQYEAQLPRDFKLAEGDPIVAPSLSDKPFGFVSGIVSDPADPFEKILFAPEVNIYELRWVLIGHK